MVDSDFGFGGGESSQEEDEEDNNNNNESCAALEASALEASALEASALEASALEASALEEASVKEAAVEEEEEVADGNGGALIAVQASEMVVQPSPTHITTNNQDTPRNNNNNNNNNSLEDLLCDSNEDDSDGEGATCWDEEDPMLEESIGDSNDDRVDGVDEDEDIQATPQETETKKRRRFTIQQKMSLVRSIQAKMDRNGTSMRQVCSDLNLNTKPLQPPVEM
ncbi:hypothetical protein ACA910_018042 [Epithemia clementina (nom. ined.)]